MNFPFYIAQRYLVAKKSQNVINIISLIAVTGVMVGTMALIIVLSVFNGFDRLVKSLFNSFDPDLKITAVEGKVFSTDSLPLEKLKKIPGILYISEVLEENALLKYGDKQYIATIKGVDSAYTSVSGINQQMYDGEFMLQHGDIPYAVVGQGIAYYMGIGVKLIDPIWIYVPRRSNVSLNDPARAFQKKAVFAAGIFRIEQDFDSRYIFVPLEFAKDILEYRSEISALEVKCSPTVPVDRIRKDVSALLGKGFHVKDRYQQQEFFYKVMKSEKWAIFFILTFILIIASFNIVGSITMLILDKKKDIAVLSGLGASPDRIRQIFLFEGLLISFTGAFLGLLLGMLICLGQMHFGWITLPGSGSFVIDTYPVYMKITDFVLVFFTVLFIGYLASWYPVRFITRRHFIEYSNL
ncbi:MAG: ABC transporter permease [Bacteroidales bacterium]|nr:ABC transporter permease [Bacteroidales bacterium]